MNTIAISIPVETVIAAARCLRHANRYAEATALLTSAADPDEDPRLAVARAEVLVADDWHHGRWTDTDKMRDARRIVEAHGTPVQIWDLDRQFVWAGYGRQLFTADGSRRQVSDREPAEMAELRRRAEALLDSAPDGRRRAWAEFNLGLVGDNIFGERENSPAHFAAALRGAEEHGDDYLIFESLRHLGDHDHDAGDHELTRQRWERSAHHAAKAGLVGATLAQLLLLAVSARDRDDEGGAMLLATEVHRWADAIGFKRIREQAAEFIAGVDPTTQPEAEHA
ncbi:MAG: hypothetical protein ACRD0P_26835 [Stackebrandtia sp.]